MRNRYQTHTHPLVLEYFACPSCGYIIESKKPYAYELKEWKKDVHCPRCQHTFAVKKEGWITGEWAYD